MSDADAKRALQIVALRSARIEILAGWYCRNPQVQILGSQPLRSTFAERIDIDPAHASVHSGALAAIPIGASTAKREREAA